MSLFEEGRGFPHLDQSVSRNNRLLPDSGRWIKPRFDAEAIGEDDPADHEHGRSYSRRFKRRKVANNQRRT